MSKKYVPLSALIKSVQAPRAAEGDFPILSMTMRSGLVDQAEKFKKRVASEDTSNYKVVRRGQLVIGFPIDEGVLSFQELYDKAIVSPAYDIWDLRDTALVDARYLELFLRGPEALRFYASKLRSTTARRRTLPDDIFLNLSVPLPALREQRRLVAILDKVDELRRQRRRTVDILEDLEKSVFYKLFGDPVLNSQRWPSRRFDDVAAIERGKFTPRPRNDPSYYDGPYPFIQTGDISRSRGGLQELESDAQ